MTNLTKKFSQFTTKTVFLKLFVDKIVYESAGFVLRGSRGSWLLCCLSCTPGYDVHINHGVNDQKQITTWYSYVVKKSWNKIEELTRMEQTTHDENST